MISRIAIEARPYEVKRFSWTYPIHEFQEDDYIPPLVKRKGVGMLHKTLFSFLSIVIHLFLLGWGKREAFMMPDHPYASHENSARMWFEDK